MERRIRGSVQSTRDGSWRLGVSPEAGAAAEQIGKTGWRALAVQLSLGLLLVLAPVGSVAFPFDPAGGPVHLDAPNLIFLDLQSPDGYFLNLGGSVTPPFNGTAGEKVHIFGDVTFNVPTEFGSVFEGGLLVFVSIRQMNTESLTCTEGSFPERLPFTVTSIPGNAIEATDSSPGALCDFGVALNGAPPPFVLDGLPVEFLALQFSGAPGETHHFEFDLEVLPGNDFTQDQLDAFNGIGPFNEPGVLLVNSAFAVVPEPGTLLLLSAGLLALAICSRQRRVQPSPIRYSRGREAHLRRRR